MVCVFEMWFDKKNFLQFFFFWAFINILTGTLDGSLSLFALFVIRLETLSNLLTLNIVDIKEQYYWNMRGVHHLIKVILILHDLTQDYISHVLSLKMKVQTCDSFNKCTLVDLPLSVE